jgi:MoaA/NifB/PqqE/SkfB family radical SAM enzyme
MRMGDAMALTVDIEPTNRCNAKCYFCPRDATPHQGLMAPEVFEQALSRVVELRTRFTELGRPSPKVSLCGLGEPLLNRHTPQFVRRVREAGFSCTMSTNAALLDERRTSALLEAGLQQICINVGDRDEQYDDVYKLPWEKTRDNVLRFRDRAGKDCIVFIVLVNHRGEPEHIESMRSYWREHGLQAFIEYEIMNRGGALFVDHMQYEQYPQLAEARELLHANAIQPVCPTPFSSLFVGYDGQYYLCCSDWKKEVPLGNVADVSFADVVLAKLAHTRDRGLVCRTCNLDPLNRLVEVMRAHEAGEVDADEIARVLEKIRGFTDYSLDHVEVLTGRPAPAVDGGPTNGASTRRTIPVTAI